MVRRLRRVLGPYSWTSGGGAGQGPVGPSAVRSGPGTLAAPGPGSGGCRWVGGGAGRGGRVRRHVGHAVTCDQLEHLLRAVVRVVEVRDLVVIGSQAIPASYPHRRLPGEATRSVAVDVAVDLARLEVAVDDVVLADRIGDAIGEGSPLVNRVSPSSHPPGAAKSGPRRQRRLHPVPSRPVTDAGTGRRHLSATGSRGSGTRRGRGLAVVPGLPFAVGRVGSIRGHREEGAGAGGLGGGGGGPGGAAVGGPERQAAVPPTATRVAMGGGGGVAAAAAGTDRRCGAAHAPAAVAARAASTLCRPTGSASARSSLFVVMGPSSCRRVRPAR